MDKISESNRWIEFAENDYEAAILLEKNIKPLIEIKDMKKAVNDMENIRIFVIEKIKE